MIPNLKEFNKSVEHHHFKMDTLDTVTKMIKPGCYVASVDLKDAYYTVPIQEDDQNFLKFGYKVCLYKYTCLPNGLSTAPRIFTKMIKPGPYKHGLYWWLILARWHQGWMQATIVSTVNLFTELGFYIHPNKSVFQPTQTLTFLGFILNSVKMTSHQHQER